MSFATIKIRGLAPMMAKLEGRQLWEAAVRDSLLPAAVKRMKRGGKGIGSRRNTVTGEVHGLYATVTTTLINPRNTGRAWKRYQRNVFRRIGRNVMKKTVKMIQAKWAGEA